MIDEFLVKLRKGFLVFGYADDVAIVALSILKECIDDILKIIQNWCKDKDYGHDLHQKVQTETIKPLKLLGKELTFANSMK